VNALTTLQAAKIMGRTRVRVWQLIKSGRIKAVYIGRQWLILPESLRTYMEIRSR
jgi:excisionase family DNA binding protein